MLGYLFDFKGRINRAKLWAYLLVAFGFEVAILIIAVVGLHVFALLDPAPSQDWGQAVGPGAIVSAIAIAILLVLFYWSSLAVLVKRLHDRNRRAIWLLYFFVGPLLFEIIGAAAGYAVRLIAASAAYQALAELPFLALAVALFGWGFVDLYCLRGTMGANRFGPDPLAKG
jgi:uncharacterized membrane protein YhaH (DUF805 family)